MKYPKIIAATAAVLTLTACANGAETESESGAGAGDDTAQTSAPAGEGAATSGSDAPAGQGAGVASEQPSAADLNAVLAKATDPGVPQEEKVNTVQGGESAPELFETMAASKAESGAEFTVVDPVLPGYTPDSVLATVNFTVPNEPAQTAENVEFIFENGNWKLSQTWACTLIKNTVTPDQVPQMCNDTTTETGS